MADAGHPERETHLDLDAACDAVAQAAERDGWEVLRLAVVEPPPIELGAALARTLAAPLGSPPLQQLVAARVREADARARAADEVPRVAIITSDATRAVPTAALLDGVVPELLAAGVPLDGIEVVVGVGAHRGARAEEMHAMLGPRWSGKLRIRNHDPHAADLVPVGATPRGTRVRVDRGVVQADLRIAFGQVEPHEFAGFTGGRKSILPAVADYQTTLVNHELAMLESPFARPGVLDGNPVHEEMLAAARLAGLDFIVNVVLDRELRPLAVAAGDVEAAHAELVRFVRGYAEVRPPEGPVDVVVTGPGRPLDINLYQAIKPLVALEPLLARSQDPAVVLLAACTDGTGSQEMLEPFAAAAAAFAHSDPAASATCACGGAAADPAAGPGEAAGAPAAALAPSDAAGAPAADPSGPGSAARICVQAVAAGPESARGFAAAVLDELRQTYTIEMDHSYFVCRFLGACRRVVACCPGVSAHELGLFGFTQAADPLAAWRWASAGRRPCGVPGRLPGPAHRPRLLVFPRPQRALPPRDWTGSMGPDR